LVLLISECFSPIDFFQKCILFTLTFVSLLSDAMHLCCTVVTCEIISFFFKVKNKRENKKQNGTKGNEGPRRIRVWRGEPKLRPLHACCLFLLLQLTDSTNFLLHLILNSYWFNSPLLRLQFGTININTHCYYLQMPSQNSWSVKT
jgi:hypothetical protein